ncbi:hypothetical protein ACFQ0T_07275 [Kitasatospora gansuensis]
MAATAKLRHGIPRVSAGRWAGLLICAASALVDGLVIGSRSVIGGLGLLLLLLPVALLIAVGTSAKSTLPVAPVLLGLLACGLLGLALATGGPVAYAALGTAVLLTLLSAAARPSRPPPRSGRTALRRRPRGPARRLPGRRLTGRQPSAVPVRYSSTSSGLSARPVAVSSYRVRTGNPRSR